MIESTRKRSLGANCPPPRSGVGPVDAANGSFRQHLTLHVGDALRWTGTDHERGLVNADRAQLTGIARDALTVTTADGRALRLECGDPMLKRLDLAYATSTHAAQGATSDLGIVAADSREGRLITTSLLRVPATIRYFGGLQPGRFGAP